MPNYVDPAQFQTDQILAGIESRVHDAYDQAWREMEAKAKKKLASFEEAKMKALDQFINDEITEQELNNWLYRQTAMNNTLQDVVNVLADDMHNANLIAMKIANGGMADVYAVNANYTYYDILAQAKAAGYSSGVIDDLLINNGIGKPYLGASFALYSKETAELLLKTEWSISPEPGKNALLPKPSAKKKKELAQLKKTSPDELWNRQKLQSAITQGVLQGEGMQELANRLRSVAKMNERQAIRNARTMTTNVQNMGRNRAYLNAKDMDIDLTIEWYAIIDGVTRHSHRRMHGQTKKNTQTAKFPNGLRWPGDPAGPPGEVYNCRCTTVSWVKGYEHEAPHTSSWLEKQQLAFDDWQQGMNGTQNVPTPATAPAGPPDRFEEARRNAREYSAAEHTQDNFDWDWWRSLTPEEQDGVRTYTTQAYTRMNGLLRGTIDYSERRVSKNPEWWKDAINNCTDGLSHRGLANDTKLYRGMGSNNTLARALNIDKSDIVDLVHSGGMKGMRFVEDGFCSCGIDPSSGWEKQVIMEIVAPKGTLGFYVDPISANSGEMECLLQRGTIFEIDGAEYIDGGVLKLLVTAVGNAPLSPVV